MYLLKPTGQIICDLLRDNPAHPAKIDFLLEAIIVTKVTFWWKHDYYSNGSADPWTRRYQSIKPATTRTISSYINQYVEGIARERSIYHKWCHFKLSCSLFGPFHSIWPRFQVDHFYLSFVKYTTAYISFFCYPHKLLRKKIPVGGCILDCFLWSSPPCFFTFCNSAIPTSCYIFNVFYCLLYKLLLKYQLVYYTIGDSKTSFFAVKLERLCLLLQGKIGGGRRTSLTSSLRHSRYTDYFGSVYLHTLHSELLMY